MTNWEKWREGLKPDDLFVFSVMHDQQIPALFCMENCPARGTCPVVRSAEKLRGKQKAGRFISKAEHNRHRKLAMDCKRWFCTWAHSEHKEADK